MLITSLESVSKTRTRVTFDYDKTLVLSTKDIAIYGIREDREIDEAVYATILKEQRSAALVRAGNLLKGMDYTVKGLTDKLRRAGYPEEIVQDVVQRLGDAGYLDDHRYAESYVRLHLADRSLARIRMDLQQKGIDRDLLADVLRDYEDENEGGAAQQELEQIGRILLRKHYDPETMTYEETARIKAALLRKGYSMERIRQSMDSVRPC